MVKKPILCWLASDTQNKVALFESGKAGPIPMELRDADLFPRHQLLDQLPRRGSLSYSLTGRLEPGRDPAEYHVPHTFQGSLGRVLLFLDRLDLARECFESDQAQEYPSDEFHAIIFPKLSQDLAKRLHSENACHGCFWPRAADDEKHPASTGLYFYRHLSEAWIAGPHGLEAKPADPLLVAQLPESFQRGVIELPGIEFESCARLQIARHVPCRPSELGFLDMEGLFHDSL